ncbi:hypothetical protein N6H05_14825 [Sphingobium sp. WTD-1]|uniref:hypothetical protein n=1 Tax=Sphingobium sp. WTD-1 TaxID=2979467 RepID=UPI0024DED3CD|nr:hypothetical protein [Sphingobium sp. WTD-1]WIA54338.1 hypothetical protein N6H05_14825 [Sphingobium sp. WTD-1]
MIRFRPVEPADGWHPGDLAYCVNAGGSAAMLVAGRIYTVETVKVLAHMLNCGLTLQEVRHPLGVEGFWSSRFLKLVRGHSFLKQIEAAYEHPFWRPTKPASAAA